MSLIDHPIWPELVPLLKAQRYDRDGGHAHPRYRIEVKLPPERALLAKVLALEIPCAKCRRLITPIRTRKGSGHFANWYLAVSCELRQRYSCARSRASAEEYVRIVDAIHAHEASAHPRQAFDPVLF